jgi:CRISPR-associated protein Csm2
MPDHRKDPQSKENIKFKVSWIQKRIEPETIDFAEQFGKHLVENRLTTNQIRNFYSEVKRLEGKIRLLAAQEKSAAKKDEENPDLIEYLNDDEFIRDFLLLRPKIAYAAQRADSPGIRDFKSVMEKALAAVDFDSEKGVSKRGFDNFADIFEAIIAYHKVAGGR